jgi:flagellin
MLSIRTPIALRFGAALSSRQAGLSRSLERLSSGLRINRAADDAAGLGVATNLETAARSVRVARRNVRDAMSAADTADSALHEVADHLQRMRELAVASASETYDDDERAYLDDEFGERLDEIDRIANGTEVLGTRVLSPGSIDIILMVDTSGSMGGEIASIRTQVPLMRQALEAEGLDVRMSLVQVSSLVDPGDGSEVLSSLSEGNDNFDSALSAMGVTGVGYMDPYSTMLDVTGVAPLAGASDEPDLQRARSGTTQKVIIYASDAGLELSQSAATEASTGEALSQAGWTVHAMVRTGPHGAEFDDLTSETGGSMQDMNALGTNMGTMLSNIADDIRADARPVDGIEVQAGIESDSSSRIELGFPIDATTYGLGIDSEQIATIAGAQSALGAIDAALDAVGSGFANIGASRNRLDNAENLATSQELVMEQARSRIEDTDFAEETAETTRLQILQQSAAAALAQAQGVERDAVAMLLG